MCCFLEIGDRRYITAKIVFIHDDRFHSRLHPQFACMIFIYSQSFMNHFTGLFGTNIMNIFQLAVCSVDGALFKSEFFCCFFFKASFLLLLKKCALLRRSLSFQIGKRWRNQSFGKCTDSPTNQFSNTFIVNLV